MDNNSDNRDAEKGSPGSPVTKDTTGQDSVHGQDPRAEVLALGDIDPALSQKRHLVNNVSILRGG